MKDETSRENVDPTALHRELAAARAEAETLAGELNAICAESAAALEDLRRLVLRYQDVQQDSAATQSRIAAIRASNTWRAVEALRRMRARLGLKPGASPPASPTIGSVAFREERAARRQRRRLSRHGKRHGRSRPRQHPID